MVHTAVPISLLGMQCTTALRSKKIQSQKPTKHEKQQSPFSSLNLGASLPQTPFCFSPWHSLAPTPRHWGTGEGSWGRPRLPNTGNPVKTLGFRALPHSKHSGTAWSYVHLQQSRLSRSENTGQHCQKISALLVLGTTPCTHTFPACLQLQK